ncbi:hypothetical protein GCM10008967_32580 [Bacillus carboniphilus]|uniref:Uncharacterized protein n=1 Tax=Bacillus carboniphilus TaxID=86663 RepID=A0ABN0WKC9_9BACI
MYTDKKRVISLLIFWAVFFMTAFSAHAIYKEWDMIQMKRGVTAPMWWSMKPGGGYEDDDILRIKVEDKYFEELDVRITDLFYMPNLERIHFGLWFDQFDYEDTGFVFHVQAMDDQGNVYEHNTVSSEGDSWFGEFQRRAIQEIQLDNIEELELYIYPMEWKNGKEVLLKPEKKLVYTKEMEPLPVYMENPNKEEPTGESPEELGNNH